MISDSQRSCEDSRVPAPLLLFTTVARRTSPAQGLRRPPLGAALSDASSRPGCSRGPGSGDAGRSASSPVTSGSVRRQCLDTADAHLRWGPPGFPTIKLMFFPFPAPFIQNESLSPARGPREGGEAPPPGGKMIKNTVSMLKPPRSLRNTLSLLFFLTEIC